MKTSMLILLLTAALAVTTFGEPGTQCAYWPARESSWIRYKIFRIQAHWSQATKQLTVCSRYPTSAEAFFKVSWVTGPSVAPSFNEISECIPFNPANGMTSGKLGNIQFAFADSGSQFIGELGVADEGFLVAPPEPKIPCDPIAWFDHQTRLGSAPLRTVHHVLDSRSGALKMRPLVTNFTVIGHYTNWGPHPDCWRTSLQEGDAMPAPVYNYVFARDIGPIDVWYVNDGSFDSRGMGWGWEFYAVDWMP